MVVSTLVALYMRISRFMGAYETAVDAEYQFVRTLCTIPRPYVAPRPTPPCRSPCWFDVRDGLAVDEALDAPMVLGVFIELPDDAMEEFVDWYQTEHTSIVLGSPLWRMIRHMRIVDADPNPFTHMFIHYIESEDALESDALAAARATEWRNRLAQNDWFKTHLVVYHRHGKRYHKAEPEAATFTLDI